MGSLIMTTMRRLHMFSYVFFVLLPSNWAYSMICAPGFTQVCPMMDTVCPDETEKICPSGAQTESMRLLDRNEAPESGCQCIPDFLISMVKDKVEMRADANAVPDFFKKEKIKIGTRTCTCNLKLLSAGNKIDTKSTAKCDRKCSGTVQGVILEGKSGRVYNVSMQMKKGRGKVSGTTNSGSTSLPPTPACTCVQKKESSGGPEVVDNEVTFTENGETYIQKDSYNQKTNEAKIIVPAHGDFEATTFILQDHSSNSPVAGKMIVSSGRSCSLEDIPPMIDLNQMKTDEKHKRTDIRKIKEIKVYQVKTETREATEEEYKALTESMKEECSGKTLVVSSTESINEEQFLMRNMANFTINMQRSNNGVSRSGCNNLFYGCSVTSGRTCKRWTYQGLESIGQNTGLERLTYHIYGTEEYCTRCCLDENTPFLPCSCIRNEQTFSTSFAIARASAFFGFDCLKRSRYCKWTEDRQVSGCNYTANGSCQRHRDCPLDCWNQECTPTTTTTTTPTTKTSTRTTTTTTTV